MYTRALVVSCVVLGFVISPANAQTIFQNPQDVCSSIESINNTNKFNRYESCLYDNEGTLLYQGACGSPSTDSWSIQAYDLCESFVAALPVGQVNGSGSGGSTVGGGINTVLLSVFGGVAILAMSRIGGY